MSEREEVSLRRGEQTWQSKQARAGLVAFFTICLAGYQLIRFFLAPSGQSAGILGVFVVLMLLSCGRMLQSAWKVAEIQNRLGRARRAVGIIDVEVVPVRETWSRPTRLLDRPER